MSILRYGYYLNHVLRIKDGRKHEINDSNSKRKYYKPPAIVKISVMMSSLNVAEKMNA